MTPLITQYNEMKAKHPDAIILMRVGDFYETFEDDAKTVSEICKVALTTRSNGESGEKVYLAGFPHHALDSYLPKMVRAGRRVAISEQLADGNQKVVESVTPSKEQSEETPAKEKPKKSAIAIKEINCTFNSEQMRNLGEPVAYFAVEIPKALRHIGKLTSSVLVQMSAVCLEPETGKMIATDSFILYSANVECSGIWPGPKDGVPFRCYIDPRAISHLAGKRVDVAVWEDENGRHIMTACEAEGVLAQYQVTGQAYPNWKRVIPSNHPASINIKPSELKALRDFMKANMGKTKMERESRTVAITAHKESEILVLEITENREYPGESNNIANISVCLSENSEWYIRQIYRADLFYYSIQEDFNGRIELGQHRPAKFSGEMRESILMPLHRGEHEKTYCVKDKSEIK